MYIFLVTVSIGSKAAKKKKQQQKNGNALYTNHCK